MSSYRSVINYPTIDISSISDWKSATKTKPIRAKHVFSSISDLRIMSKLLLQTIECDQPIKSNTLVCMGEAGEPWQQSPEKVLAKYNIVGFDDDGYMICVPKPDNVVECTIVSGLSFDVTAVLPEGFSIKGLWGEKQADNSYLQYGSFGDVVCRSISDKADVWIVKRKLFDSTYEVING